MSIFRKMTLFHPPLLLFKETILLGNLLLRKSSEMKSHECFPVRDWIESG